MTSERDATSIVRSWLEDGSTGIPDHVLDAVLSELPSTPQRRPMWSLGRFLRVNIYVKLAAMTAVVVVAVAAGVVLLPRGSNVGGSAASPTPSTSPAPSSGTVIFTLGGDAMDLTLDATGNGSSISGRAKVSFGDFQEVPELEDHFTISLQCGRMFDSTTWMLAGVVDTSTHVGLKVGTRSAVIVRDGSPQEIGLWIEEPPVATDCPSFVTDIPKEAVENPGAMARVGRGSLTLPRLGG